MALPVNISDLIHQRVVESTRIEYKGDWNPEPVIHSITAFANDFDNLGGGYIVLGIEEKNGRPVFPLKGLEPFMANMQEVNYQCLKDVVQNASGIETLDHLTDMYIRLYVLGSCQLTCEWILGKREGTAEELAMVYEQTLPLPLQQYFTK